MNEDLEMLIAQGEASLEEKERKETIARIAKEEQAKLEYGETVVSFWNNLVKLLPPAAIGICQAFGNGEKPFASQFVSLRMVVDGCPIAMTVYHNKGEDLRWDSHPDAPFSVPGVASSDPCIYEGDLYPGKVEFNFKHSINFSDIREAMAAARRRAVEMQERYESNAEMEDRLRERQEQERAKLPSQTEQEQQEPVYVPADLSDQPAESILNLDELVRLIGGIVDERLAGLASNQAF